MNNDKGQSVRKDDERRGRLAAELAAHEAERRRIWGDTDERLRARFTASMCTEEEKAKVEQAMQDFPAVHESIETVRKLMTKWEANSLSEPFAIDAAEAASAVPSAYAMPPPGGYPRMEASSAPLAPPRFEISTALPGEQVGPDRAGGRVAARKMHSLAVSVSNVVAFPGRIVGAIVRAFYRKLPQLPRNSDQAAQSTSGDDFMPRARKWPSLNEYGERLRPFLSFRGTPIEWITGCSLILICIALLGPAAISAREKARRAGCQNNLKQLGVANANYVTANGAFPLGSYMMLPPGDPLSGPCSGRYEHSILVRLLPFMEQGHLYNAFNANVHYSDAANATVQSTGFETLWCPSDPEVSKIDYSLLSKGVRFTSYKGNAGTWFSPSRYADPDCPQYDFRAQIDQANGIFNFYSKTTIKDITDGTSYTMLMGEAAYGKLSPADRKRWAWWTSGNYGDTMFMTSYPLNPFDKTGEPGTEAWINTDLYPSAASSFHPGGANFTFCDGSVRFIKNTIQQSPINPATLFPQNVAVSAGNVYSFIAPPSVYQSLSTRNGADVIPTDSY